MIRVRTEAQQLSSGSTPTLHPSSSLTGIADFSWAYAIRYQTLNTHNLQKTDAIHKRWSMGVSD
jgi:hypothetical protein